MASRTFSDGQAVDSVETEKSRIVIHELEKGWWILAVGIRHCSISTISDITCSPLISLAFPLPQPKDTWLPTTSTSSTHLAR